MIPPPNSCLAISPPRGQMERHEPRRVNNFAHPQSEAIPHLDGTRSYQRPDIERVRMASSSATSDRNADKIARGTQAEEENARGRHLKPEPTHLCRESKRKHAVYAQDEQGRYSDEIWEDIPHMSEIESDHGFRPVAKDVFGLKGQRSLFAEVCHSSSNRFDPGRPCMLTEVDATVIQNWRRHFHSTQQAAQPLRNFSPGHIRLQPTFLELLSVDRGGSSAARRGRAWVHFLRHFTWPDASSGVGPWLRTRALQPGLCFTCALSVKPYTPDAQAHMAMK